MLTLLGWMQTLFETLNPMENRWVGCASVRAVTLSEGKMMDLNLSGKTALVGGASRGIGAASARQLASQGARVIAMARSEEALSHLCSELGEGHSYLVVSDTEGTTDIENLSEKVREKLREYGPISILICNSGGPPAGPIIKASQENFLSGFYNHVLVNQTLVQLLFLGMRDQGFGRIINIISTSVKIPIPNLGVSNTIRGAVASWSKTLANELGPFHITVNNVLPGFTNTERLHSLKEAAGKRLGQTTTEVEEMWKKTIPANRFADPRETAYAVGFLASPAASYINGVSLPVDGGRTGSL